MLIPIRCFGCGKVVANKSERYQLLLEAGFHETYALDYLGLRRVCCRRMLLTNIELVDKMIAYQQLQQPVGRLLSHGTGVGQGES